MMRQLRRGANPLSVVPDAQGVIGQQLMGAVWPRPYPSQAARCRHLITSLRRDGPPQPDYRPTARRFAASPWHLSSLSPPAPVKVAAAIMFIYAFIGFQALRNPPSPSSSPYFLPSLPPLSSSGSFYPINGHWRVDGGSAQLRRVLDWCCLVKEKHTPTHATHAHTNPSLSCCSGLSAALLSFLWASAMYEIKDSK